MSFILYAYTFPSLIRLAKYEGKMLVKVGHTNASALGRILEQNKSACSFEPPIMLKSWIIEKTKSLLDDNDLHINLEIRGYKNPSPGHGKEWFLFPFETTDLVIQEVEAVIAESSVKFIYQDITQLRRRFSKTIISMAEAIDIDSNRKIKFEMIDAVFNSIDSF